MVSVFLAVLCPAVQPCTNLTSPVPRHFVQVTRSRVAFPPQLSTGFPRYRCPLFTSSEDPWFLRRSCSSKKLHAHPRLFPSLRDGDGGDMMTEVVVPPKYYEVDRVAATSGKTLGVVLARLFLFERDDRFTFILHRDRMTTSFATRNQLEKTLSVYCVNITNNVLLRTAHSLIINAKLKNRSIRKRIHVAM